MLFARCAKSFSVVGAMLGFAVSCASLTPSLLPRIPEVQGVLAGVSFVAGYGIGNLLYSIWTLLELPQLSRQWEQRLSWAGLICAALITGLTLNRMLLWQNSIRDLMEMTPVDSAYPLRVLGIAVVTIVVLIALIRVLIWCSRRATDWFNRVMPRRISIGLGTVLVVIVLTAMVDGLIVRNTLSAMDNAFAQIDLITDDGVNPPPGMAGPPALIDWDDIGRNGKRFLTDGPDRQEIAEFTGRAAQQPVRVYAGYNTGETLEERADIALAELIRTGGFDRSALVIATPTGTGWLDPAAVQPMAFLHNGDLAMVSMQYSYLPSWLTLMVDPSGSRQAARALFRPIFEHWRSLSPNARPKLYLFGLSLGALGSEASTDLVELLGDPIHGAMWSGPPFASNIWSNVTANRVAGSPQWRPRFRDGELVRFSTQDGFDPQGFASWGPMRLVYLQHASDPMSFFSPTLAFSRPDWLTSSRGRDVSPYFRWHPIVTFLQVGFDIPMATTVSMGYGHNFAPAEYIDAWLAVTEPEDWSESDTKRLKALFQDFNPSPI